MVVLIAAILAFVIWIELACRAALVLMLVAFVPLAFAGLFWHVTAKWTRRLLEMLAAVILAQLVITVLMVLAAAALAHPGQGLASGIDGVAVGSGVAVPRQPRVADDIPAASACSRGGGCCRFRRGSRGPECAAGQAS